MDKPTALRPIAHIDKMSHRKGDIHHILNYEKYETICKHQWMKNSKIGMFTKRTVEKEDCKIK